MVIEDRNPTPEEYRMLREAVGWWLTDASAAEQALGNSIYSVVAVDGEKTVGMGRVVGDNGLYYYIQDVIVHPDYQGRRIGKDLMEKLMHFLSENAKSGAFIALMAAKGLEPYYRGFGFKPRPKDGPGMYLIVE